MPFVQLLDLFILHASRKDKDNAERPTLKDSDVIRKVLANLVVPPEGGGLERQLTVGDLDGRLLQFASAARPRKRCVLFQAGSALFRASSNPRFLRDGVWPTATPVVPLRNSTAQSRYAVRKHAARHAATASLVLSPIIVAK